MTELMLSSLFDETEALIESEAYQESITLCQHSLRCYPKNIRTYSLLGENCAGLGNFRESADMFRRLLSADPEDSFARAALGELFATEGMLDEALWQTERAFELDPGNEEVRSRLRDLHAERHNIQPDRLKLNGAALGRLYARGGWHDLAIQEFLSVLEKDPARVDIRIALAESLWAAGRRQEAAVICEELLIELPNCLKANLILGQVWTDSGLDEGWDRLQLAQALDPENRVAERMFGPESPLHLQEVKIPPVGAPPPVMVEESPEAEPALLPDWLQSLSAEEPEIRPVAPLPPIVAREGEGLWVVDLREATEKALAAYVHARPEPETIPGWVSALRTSTALALQERGVTSLPPAALLPAWVAELRSAVALALEQRQMEPEALPAPAAEWVGDLRVATAQALAQKPAPPEETTTIVPSWVSDLRQASEQAISSLTVAAEDLKVAPDQALPEQKEGSWVTALREETATGLSQWKPAPAPAAEQPPTPEPPTAAPAAEQPPTPEPPTAAPAAEQPRAPEPPTAAPAAEQPPTPEPAAAAPAAEQPVERLAELYQELDRDPNNHALRLELALVQKRAGNRSESLLQFSRLARDAKEIAPQMIDVLETWAQEDRNDLEVQQMLGDAYANADRLPEALAQYRLVLDMSRHPLQRTKE